MLLNNKIYTRCKFNPCIRSKPLVIVGDKKHAILIADKKDSVKLLFRGIFIYYIHLNFNNRYKG